MTLSSEDRGLLVGMSLEKSEENIGVAKLVLDTSPNKAASAAYYSAFHSLQALFLDHRLVTTKKRGHRSGIDLFNRDFIRTGIFPKEMGSILGRLESLRNIGDYAQNKNVSREQADEAIKSAEKFNATIREHIQERKRKEELTTPERKDGITTTAAPDQAAIDEIEAAARLLGAQRATDNSTFRGHELTAQQNDTLDLLEQIKRNVQADKDAMAKLKSAGLDPKKDITDNKIVRRPGQFPRVEGADVVSRTKDSLTLVRGRTLFIYELKRLELKAPAQGVPGEKLDLKWLPGEEKATASQSQERERKRERGRSRTGGDMS